MNLVYHSHPYSEFFPSAGLPNYNGRYADNQPGKVAAFVVAPRKFMAVLLSPPQPCYRAG